MTRIPASTDENDLDPALTERVRRAYADVAQPDELGAVLTRGRRLRQAHRNRRRAGAVAFAGVAAAAAVAVAAPGVVPGLDRREPVAVDAPVTLVSMAAPTFPFSLDGPKAGLGPAHYSQDPDGTRLAVYLDAGGDVDDSVVLAVRDRRGDELDEPGVAVSTRRKLGDLWVTVIGNGRWAQESIVEGIADDLVEEPVRVPLRVKLAPAGWVVEAYKDDRVLTLDDPRSDDMERTINVHLPERWEDDYERATGATSSEAVKVNGKAAVLVEAQGLQMLQGRLPDGTPFVLQVPRSLTRAQVLDLAGAVERG